MKIYEITSVMRALMDTLSDMPLNEDGKPLNEEAQAEHDKALAAFESSSEDLRIKLHAMTAYALELKVEREARQAHMDAIVANTLDKMDKANQRDAKKEAWLLEQVRGAMQVAHIEKQKYEEFTIALQKMPHTAEIANAEALPKDYLRVIPAVAESTAPDKKKILSDLKDGVVIPGAALSQPAFKLTVK